MLLINCFLLLSFALFKNIIALPLDYRIPALSAVAMSAVQAISHLAHRNSPDKHLNYTLNTRRHTFQRAAHNAVQSNTLTDSPCTKEKKCCLKKKCLSMPKATTNRVHVIIAIPIDP